MNISHFDSFFVKPKDTTIEEVLDKIRSGKYQQQIVTLRQFKKGDRQYDQIKTSLHHFTASGSFLKSRKEGDLYEYSRIILLDIDNVTDPEALKNQLKQDDHVHFAFISPGGKGLKVGVRVNTQKEYHKIAFQQVRKHFEGAYDIVIDISGKDVSRACFYSYDPALYHNTKATLFKVDISQASFSTAPGHHKSDNIPSPVEDKFNQIFKQAEEQFPFDKGSRNNHCHHFGCICNRDGVDQGHATEYYYRYKEEDFPESEIKNSIESAYKNRGEYGLNAYDQGPILPNSGSKRSKWFKRGPSLASGPDFDTSVYDNIPDIFKEVLKLSNHSNQDGVALLGVIGVLSSLFPNATVLNNNKKYEANLYLLVLAQAASGKGILEKIGKIVDTVEEKIADGQYNKILRGP